MKVIIIKKIGIIVIFLILALSLTCVSANEITNESQDDTLKVSEDIDNLESESTQDQLSSAQLELDNDADKENINLGDEVTWIVTAQNFGPDTAKNLKYMINYRPASNMWNTPQPKEPSIQKPEYGT